MIILISGLSCFIKNPPKISKLRFWGIDYARPWGARASGGSQSERRSGRLLPTSKTPGAKAMECCQWDSVCKIMRFSHGMEASFGVFPRIGSRFRESFQTLETGSLPLRHFFPYALMRSCWPLPPLSSGHFGHQASSPMACQALLRGQTRVAPLSRCFTTNFCEKIQFGALQLLGNNTIA